MSTAHSSHARPYANMLAAVFTSLWLTGPSAAIAQDMADLIRGFDAEKNVVQGDWELLGGQLRVIAGEKALAELPGNVPAAYRLSIEFTRTGGDDAIGVILPVGGRQCILNLGVFRGEAHGIGTVDGKLARDNDTTIRPGRLVNGQRYRLVIDVSANQTDGQIRSTLDGKPLLEWSGTVQSLALLDFWKLPRTDSIGLFANCDVVFHTISLQRTMTTNSPMTRPVSDQVISFQGQKWSTSRAQAVTVETFRGRPALHVVGQEAAFVPLVAADFGSGTIEVDIASKTFSGIGFRGNAGGTVVEKVYFRPQNSGTEKHDRSVQYSLLGGPKFGWQQLREAFPGKFESGANLPLSDWFHVRVVVNSDRAEIYVDDDADPVLVVDELLGDRANGTIGVWGWDSYFSDFRFEEAR